MTKLTEYYICMYVYVYICIELYKSAQTECVYVHVHGVCLGLCTNAMRCSMSVFVHHSLCSKNG